MLDEAFPNCACEEVALRAGGGEAVNDNEQIARILTTPDGFDLSANELITSKLTSVYGCGFSVIRSGASDAEIRLTIDKLVNKQSEKQELVGAALVKADVIRSMHDGIRWFGVYATDDDGKEHHADLLGTRPKAESKSQIKKQQNERRYRLRDVLGASIIRAADVDELISLLRQAGI